MTQTAPAPRLLTNSFMHPDGETELLLDYDICPPDPDVGISRAYADVVHVYGREDGQDYYELYADNEDFRQQVQEYLCRGPLFED